jgi:anti-anti-sigma factor
MDMHVQQNGDTSTIFFDKEKLFGTENESFKTLIRDSIEAGSKNIVVDLGNVNFITSLGIESFIHACAICKVKYVSFSLINVKASVKNVFSTLRLSDLMRID